MKKEKNLYLDVIKRFITGQLQIDLSNELNSQQWISLQQCQEILRQTEMRFQNTFELRGINFKDIICINEETILASLNKMHFQKPQYTMSSEEILDNVIELSERVINDNIKGDFIEAGCIMHP